MKLCEKGWGTDHQPNLRSFKDDPFGVFKKDDEGETGISN